MEEILEVLGPAIPFFALACILHVLLWRKNSRARRLHEKARQLLASGQTAEAREALLEALWAGNEDPGRERHILRDLKRVAPDFPVQDYKELIGQFERLHGKTTHGAITAIKDIQRTKRLLLDRAQAKEPSPGAAEQEQPVQSPTRIVHPESAPV